MIDLYNTLIISPKSKKKKDAKTFLHRVLSELRGNDEQLCLFLLHSEENSQYDEFFHTIEEKLQDLYNFQVDFFVDNIVRSL